MQADITEQLRNFVCTNYLFGDRTRAPGDHDSLIGSGVIDSTGILELIEFVEDNFHIEVSETETIPQNLDSISNLTRFVLGKLGRLSSSPAAGV